LVEDHPHDASSEKLSATTQSTQATIAPIRRRRYTNTAAIAGSVMMGRSVQMPSDAKSDRASSLVPKLLA
jgi:hypothetical protein